MVWCALYSKRIILTAVTNGALSIYRRPPMMGMLARKLPLPLPLLPLDALLVLVLKRFPTMGMLLGSSRLLVPPLLLAALPLPPRSPPTIGMLARLRPPLLLF